MSFSDVPVLPPGRGAETIPRPAEVRRVGDPPDRERGGRQGDRRGERGRGRPGTGVAPTEVLPSGAPEGGKGRLVDLRV